MKKGILCIIGLTVALSLFGCSSKVKDNYDSSSSSSSNTLITDVPNQVVEKAGDVIGYTALGEFKVFGQDAGLGVQVLVDEKSTKEDIIKLITKMSENKDPVSIDIYFSKAAYEDFKKATTATEETKKNYVASYVKNKTLSDKAFYGDNEINWLQEIGSLASLKGTTTKLD